ncbi:MAG: transcription antitermination factor NusB [Spirochaetales bacterium]|nr:transcription antitermination factor NusB [Spirochaetales bacterium]
MGSRRKGRVIAFQALFAWDATKPAIEDLVEFHWLETERRDRLGADVLAFAGHIVGGTIENIDRIDETIKNHTEHWDLDRIARVDLAILRTSIYALIFQPEIPPTVTIDEAIEIAKQFGSDESYKFINGVLDGVRKAGGKT